MMIHKNSKRNKNLMSEINVTPLVDVMLVLLIVFMVTSPMLVAGVKVDLPETSAAPLMGDDEPLSVTIDAKNKIYIHNSPIEINDLEKKLIAVTKEKLDTRIFVRGDKKVDYGAVMEVIAKINNAGFSKVSLVTEIEK